MIKINVYLKSGEHFSCDLEEDDYLSLKNNDCFDKELKDYGVLSVRKCDISAVLRLK